MTAPICPCDNDIPRVPVNLPQQTRIAFRFGDYRQFRRALLTPEDTQTSPIAKELPLAAWRTQGAGDLAVMMAEWFAYLADIITFYDERIANQSYLRTADRDASVQRLIRVLGYRPRPAIGATGTLAALVTPGQSAVLPKGLQFQSKPAVGQSPQTFELDKDTAISGPDRVPARKPPVLLAAIAEFRFSHLSIGIEYAAPKYVHATKFSKQAYTLVSAPATAANYGLLLLGAVTTLDPGTRLRLRQRDSGKGGPFLATVTHAVVQDAPAGGKQTALALEIQDSGPRVLTAALAGSLAAADVALELPTQSIALWSLYTGGVSGTTVHLSSLARQVHAKDWVLFVAPSWTFFTLVSTTIDVIWDANSPAVKDHPFPVPHTQLTLASSPPGGWPKNVGSIAMHFDWTGAGQLLDQPPGSWNGTPTALVAATALHFRKSPASPVLLQDKTGAGLLASAASAGDFNMQLSDLPVPTLGLLMPVDVLYNTLSVSRGKSVTKEVLGSGDVTQAAQSFSLAQLPVTWLESGASAASTVAVRVDGEPWTEVPSLYGQPANAQVFVTREDIDGRTHVDFGDGIEGARLPSGVNNVIADYRVGAGAASPPAGKLTVIAQAFPGLRALLNPVAVGGGADAEPANQIRRYAPRSVLTFGRAVSVFDYEALAAQAPGVTRARATWSWNYMLQRAAVVVYVGDDLAAVKSARGVLAAAGDPNRPVRVEPALAAQVALTLTVLIVPGWDRDAIISQVQSALCDPETGLFGPLRMGIAQVLFDSQIEQAVLAVRGTIAIVAASVTIDDVADGGPLHSPGEGRFLVLDSLDLSLTLQADAHGG